MSFVWGARTWVRIAKESAWGVYDNAATAVHWIRLAGDGAFSMAPAPWPYVINSADGLNEPIQTATQQIKLSGGLVTPLYHSQAADLLAWALTPRSSGSPAAYSLDSYTLDHYDGVRTRRYLGVRVAALSIAAAANGPAMLTFSLLGWKPDAADPALPEPSIADFPTTPPHILQSTKSGMKIGNNTARSAYKTVNFTATNVLDAPFCEDVYVSDILYCGRTLRLKTELAYSAATAIADRAAYESQTAQSHAELLFTQGTNSIKLDMHTNARITEYAAESPLGASKFASMAVSGMTDGSQTPNRSFTLTIV